MKPVFSFDALTLHAVADELRARILGGQVQKIVPTGPLELGLELYGRSERTNLLISADPQAARVVLTHERPARGSDTVTPLLLLLRKYVRDGRVIAVEQPRLERLLILRVSKNRDAEALESSLIIEVMGRRSNTVLVAEDETILDALRRASREKNPARPILPHLRYAPPPPQTRLDPSAADTWNRLPELAAQRPDRALAELLGGELRGFSPLLAREAAFRAGGQVDGPAGSAAWDAVHAVVHDLLAPIDGRGAWSPSVARWQGGVVAFAAYRLRHLEASCDVVDVASISQAVELAYGPHPDLPLGEGRGEGFLTSPELSGNPHPNPLPEGEGTGPETLIQTLAQRDRGHELDQLASPILAALDARRALVERRRAALGRSLAGAGDAEALRWTGETILASLHEIRPGQETLVVDGREIALDPLESGVENAQRYFRDYKRARDAGRRVPELIRKAGLEVAYLDEMRTLVELAEDPGRLRALREELRSSGVMTDRAPQKPKKGRPADEGARPLTVPLGDGFVAFVGTSAKSNERVTFDLAGQEDVWLHARNMPGAHVVVRTGGRQLPRGVLIAAAQLAAHFSRGREAGRVPVDWTLRKHVRKIRGGPAGLVSYVDEQTLDVVPQALDDAR